MLWAWMDVRESVRVRPRATGITSMTILQLKTKLSSFTRFASLCGRGILAGFGLAYCCVGTAHAWVTLDLPDLNAASPHFGAVAVSHLSDGRYIYGNNNALYVQDTFGTSGNTALATPPNVDPSFLTVLNDTTAVVGAGQFATTPVYQFNPSNPGTPGYASIASLQNFSAARSSSTSLYVVGGNGAGGSNSVNYVTTSGTSQVIIDPAGTFSAGVAVDKTGDLYVGDNDTNSVYEFTPAQVLNAVNNQTLLTFSDGLLIHTFADDVVGSLAVDANGRIWASGFGADGLFFWNPATSQGGVLNPEAPGGAYSVSTFSTSGNDYVNYVWQAGFSTGNPVVYGYDTVQNVPEPATTALLAAAVALGAVWWKRRIHPVQA